MRLPAPRLVALGLDGLSVPLARRLCELAPLPHISGLLGRAATMRAELPEVSPVNWAAFSTGLGPEGHGVFGFTRLDPQRYTLSLADSTHIRASTVFERLSAGGGVCKVLNLPGGYPARPVRGMFVAGFVAPELTRAVHPPVLAPMLRRIGYRLEADTLRGKDDHLFLLDDLADTLASRRRALELLWSGQDFDLFACILTETDRLFHFLLHAALDPAHGLHQRCCELLAAVDAAVGDLLARYEALPEPKRFMALADHGFAPLEVEVDLNVWLQQAGYLKLEGRPRDELDAAVVAATSAAVALDPGRIHLHRAGVFGRGRLHAAEALRVREEIRAGLLELTFGGRPVMAAVHRGEELYPGILPPDIAAQVPDLVCEPHPGFDLKAKFDRQDVFGRFGRSGAHVADGALWVDSAGSRPARLRDAGREVLGHFGLAGGDTA